MSPDDTDEQAQANQGTILMPGDQLLLCSDGLTDLVSDAEIQSILVNQPMAAVTENLIDLANQRGGHDNITLILLAFPSEPSKNLITTAAQWLRHSWWILLIAIAGIGFLSLIGVTLWLGVNLFSNQTLPTPNYGTPTLSTPVSGSPTTLVTPLPDVTVNPNGLSRSTPAVQTTTITLTSWPTTLLPTSTPTPSPTAQGY
jgi:sulfur transfer complex TusBCD TusB component (DsrH family)